MLKRLLPVLLLALVAHGQAVAGAYDDILVAARDNRADTVADLVRRGMDPNTSDRAGTTLLMFAAGHGNLQLVDFLVQSRANLQKKNSYGDTATAIAALRGHLAIVRRLVEAGADIAGTGWNPLHYAAFSGHGDIVAFLAGKGAPLDAPAPNGQTALMLAAKSGHADAVRALVDADADLDLEDPQGQSALALAETAGHTRIADYLREEGAEE